ncbi:zinc finger and BTB domain-containing protein 37-like isoform X1 [Clupea harengus]|uniref:Zinc finger and BTB domain-containing protein 37-like isoform X1 n=1 Tax=Clupea harengus TaxID=7950 RepID=A0A6P8G4E8_CLUHA|nr:zinc finger and BTB domain-containing protein 37-like isoform X1 [Clupea harengus]XP_031430791.1 zinc finger and BTB domain-containing protein 37-like isoform X1 [Clupea harengus]
MESTGSIQLDIPDFSNSVLSHLNQLRMQGRLCDIVVNVQGQSFRAHKVVLAASSPYFRDHMSLSEMSTVSLSVIRNPSVFEQLLSFCYTGRLCLQLADIISYLTAASFLQMQHIIDHCTQILEGIHFKINLSEVDGDLVAAHRGSGRTLEPGSVAGSSMGPHLLSPRHSTPKVTGPCGGVGAMEGHNAREAQDVSPAGNSMSPPVVEHSGLGSEAVGKGGVSSIREKEPVLRINRAGQWYVESGLEDGREEEIRVRVPDGLRIKTERLEEWGGTEMQASSAVEVSGTEEGGAPMMIDASGRSSLVQEEFVSGASGSKSSQPSSSFSETERFSPTGSVVVMAERQRAKSESPGRVYDQKHPSSQGSMSSLNKLDTVLTLDNNRVGSRWRSGLYVTRLVQAKDL